MKKLMTILTLMCFAIAVTGCNTIAGAGKDIERGGEKLQEKARGH